MTKRPLCMAAIGFIFGTLSILTPKYTFVYIVTYAFIIILNLFFHFKSAAYIRGIIVSLICIFMCIFGSLATYKSEIRRSEYLNSISENSTVTIQGHIYQKEIIGEEIILYLDSAYILNKRPISCRDVQVYISDMHVHSSAECTLGSTIITQGKYSPFLSARNPGNYDEKQYYYNQGIDIRLREATTMFIRPSPIAFREALYNLRTRMKAVLFTYLPRPRAGVLSAMILGDRRSIDSEEKSLYQSSGISHLLSVSGLHVSLLCMGAYKLLKALLRRLPSLIAVVIASAFSVVFCIFSGSSVSTIRAVGMFCISLIGIAFGQVYDSITSAAIMATALLIVNPRYILSSGFQLSFVAVVGSVSIHRHLSSIVRKIKKTLKYEENGRYNQLLPRERHHLFVIIPRMLKKISNALMESCLFSFSIGASTLPLVVYYYYEVPIYVSLVNMILLPLMGILLVFGLLGASFGAFPYLPFQQTARLLMYPCRLILWLYDKIAATSLSLPFSQLIVGRPRISGIVIYYLLLMLFIVAVSKVYASEPSPKLLYRRLKRQTICSLMSLMTLLLFFHFTLLAQLAAFVPRPMEIVMLDVGQGDGLFVRSRYNETFFVDGGSSNIKSVGQYRIMPFLKYKGVGHIDYWFVSHPDDDHISGLIELIEDGYDIRHVVFSKHISKNENYDTLCQLLKARKIDLVYVSDGDILSSKRISFNCLLPCANNNPDDTNAQSLVLLMNLQNISMLLTGDIGTEQEKSLAHIIEERPGLLNDIKLLKVAHHGSKYSSDSTFISALSPDYALVSAGQRNRYGHPHQDTIDTLIRQGADIYRTDQDGAIILSFNRHYPYIKKWISS